MKIVTPSWTKPTTLATPQVGEANQFSSSRNLRFGPLRIAKDGLIANNGTVDSVKVDSAGFHGFDNLNSETIRVDNNGISGYGDQGNVMKFSDQVGGSLYGAAGYLASNSAMYMASGNSKKLILFGDNGVSLGTNQGDTEIGNTGTGDIKLVTNTGEISGNGTTIVMADGTKLAIVPTSQGYKSLYCVESPEVWFFDFCYGRKVRKFPFLWKWEWEVKPDPLFIETTEAPYLIILTGIANTVQIWGKRRGLANKRFESKTKQEFEANNDFWNTPKLHVQRPNGKSS